MRAWYVDRRNEPILDVRMMVSFACALVLVLSWLLPREEFFRQMLAEGEADHVSIAYARLLVALNPTDAELKELLAAQYLQIGELELAWKVMGSDEGPASLLRATILLQLAFSQEEGAARRDWEALLRVELERAKLLAELDEESATGFAEAAYAIGRPELAAAYFELRFRAGGAATDLLRAAAAWRYADQAAKAADLFSTLIGSDSSPFSDQAFTAEVVAQGLESFLAASRFADGFTLIDAAVDAGNTDPGMIVRYVEFAQYADDQGRMRRYLGKLEPVDSLSAKQLFQVAGAAIAVGELEPAARFIEALLARHPDDLATREELARVYRWSGRPEAALQQWLDLVERTGNERSISAAWRLAQGLYRYDIAARLLTDLSVRRRLTDEEVVTLREAYELQGFPDAGIAALYTYLERHPGHRQAWTSLIELQEANEYLIAASESWVEFSQRHQPDIKERLRWADLSWERYRTEEAVELLLAAENRGHAEYWRRLATYAWFLDDMALVARSYAALSVLDPLDRDHFDRFLAALVLTDPTEAQEQARFGWKTFKEPVYLLQALQWAMKAGDNDLVRTLLALAEEQPLLLAGSAEYWELLAYYHQQHGDLRAAGGVLGTALIYHPDRVSLITPYLWVLIQTAEVDDLREALDRYRPIAEQSGDLWQVYASAYARLNEHQQAIAWFALAADVAPDDLVLLLAYAGSLEAVGLGDPAFRLRRHVIGQLAAGRVSSGLTLENVVEAGRGVLTDQQEQTLAAGLITLSDPQSDEEPGGQFVPDDLPRLYLAQALQRTHYSAASYWLRRDKDADVWKRLAVAADQGDRLVLESLMDHEDPIVRVNAALALDRPEVAYRDAGSVLLGDRERLGVATGYYNYFPTGWQLGPEHSQISGLNIDSLTFVASGRSGAYRVGGSVTGYRLSDDLRLVPGEVEEWLVEGTGSRRNQLGETGVSFTLLGSMDELIPGFSAFHSFDLDRRNRLLVGGGYQQLTEITALARAISQRSGLDLGWQSVISKRDRLSVKASLDYYQDRFGDALGQGVQFEARVDHALKLSGPELLIGTSLYVTANSEKAPGSELLDRLLIERGERLLPEGTGRLAFNASISRGSPGDLRWERPSPRYRLGAAVGYQWPEDSPTLEFEASVGIRILGNDELSFRTAYTSALLSAVGGDGYRATLIYSKRLGR